MEKGDTKGLDTVPSLGHAVCLRCGVTDPDEMVDLGKDRVAPVCAACYFELMRHFVQAHEALNPVERTLIFKPKGPPS